MKKTILYAFLGAATIFSSCDSFLDKLPDKRTQVDTEEKVSSILVSAYPTASHILLGEVASDNVTDNGEQKSIGHQINSDIYRFKEFIANSSGADSPRDVWNAYYSAISSANHALQAIEKMGNPETLNPQKAEALLCRAYSHFMLANIFCLSYDPSNASQALGVPYAVKPETKVSEEYSRGTLEELFQKINKDIETALPLVNDNAYNVPKYHFNEKAAYAFAARFNLFYLKYDKVIEYATKALGNSPESILRDWNVYKSYAADDYPNHYIDASEACNFLLLPGGSIAGRMIYYSMNQRYIHSHEISSSETLAAKSIWSLGASGSWLAASSYVRTDVVFMPKITEYFEYIDKAAGTGFVHIVHPVLTAGQVLLCRAEAYILSKNYAKALEDLNLWQRFRCMPDYYGFATLPELTSESINNFYNSIDYSKVVVESPADRTIKKVLNPVGFTVEAGQQENFIQCLLQARRIETLQEGYRWFDLKRYGIEFSHPLDKEDPIVILKDDPRRAYQLPQEVILAGLQANPR